MLTADERNAIAGAIAEAERATSGEIVCVVACAASDYRSFAVAVAAGVGLFVPLPLLLATSLGAGRVYIIQLLVVLVIGALLAAMPLRLALVPRALKRRRAREAARRQFLARGLAGTRDRTGVLIYVALAEHYAEVIADEGIASAADPKVWQAALDTVLDAMAAGKGAKGLEAAVRIVGEVLARHHPPRPDDINELPDRVVEL